MVRTVTENHWGCLTIHDKTYKRMIKVAFRNMAPVRWWCGSKQALVSRLQPRHATSNYRTLPPTMEPPSAEVKYTIAGCSGHSGKYVPQNILQDRPKEHSSRWSGTSGAMQWILLKLENLTVLSECLFTSYRDVAAYCCRKYHLWKGKRIFTPSHVF
jgi:hypothetical protein